MNKQTEEKDIIYQLVRSFFPVRRMYVEHFQKKQLNFSEMSAMNLLEEAGGSMRVSDLASALRVTPPTVTQLITRLERDGMLTRRIDPHDRRVVQICLLEKGREHICRVNEHVIQEFSGIYEMLGQEDTQKLIELLERVHQYFKQRYGKEDFHPC